MIKKSTTWRWGPQEQEAFDELKDKVANAKCLGVPRAQGEIILVTDASNVGGGGTLFQWQALEKEEFDSAISQWGTEGLNRDGTLKHSYPDDKWVLVPLGHWNWKWNQARGNYSTYEQELLAGMLVLSSQARLLGSNPVVWLCDQEPVRSFQKGPPPEKAKLRRWWTYLSQLRLTVHHIQGVKNECADYISRNNFDALIGDIRDRGLYWTLPIPHCANSVLYVDYTEMPKFGGYDFALVVTCGLTRFTRVFPCTKHITGEETIKILLEEWFCVYGAPKEINSDEDVRIRSDTGWYKRVLRSLNVQVSTGIPYSHTSNPLCERRIRVLKENVRI